MSLDRRRLIARSREILPQMISWRRELHRFPELGYEEHRTQERVAAVLGGLGLDVTAGLAGTGVAALLKGGAPGPCVALRAELDALPIQEETGLPYASERAGVMHACGHDGHMAALLGAATLLAEAAGEIAGSVKFIFQPAEEMLGGGKALCEAGVLEDPPVAGIFGLHLWPWLPRGVVGLREGPMMAAFDEFHLEIGGRASHGAAPHLGVDAIVAAARVVEALQHVAARESDPQEPFVLTIGRIEGGTATNVIADRARLSGSVRTFDPALRRRIPERIRRIAKGVAEAHGAEARLEWIEGYPAVVNHPGAVSAFRRAAAGIVAPERIVALERPSMASEDFAFYLERVPGAFAFLGVADSPDHPGLHTPTYTFDESILAEAAALLASVAIEALAALPDDPAAPAEAAG